MNLDAHRILPALKDMARRAGMIAVLHLTHSSPTLKPDQSVLTYSDQAISKYLREELSKISQGIPHLIIDEEDESRAAVSDQRRLESVPYLWAVDPIDGTRLYANQMPHYGISIGLLKELKPWLGIVYFPSLRELFYCDGERSFFVRNVFTAEESVQPILPVEQDISAQSIFLCPDNFFEHFEWHSDDCHIVIPASAVVDLCWPAIGRGWGV